MDKQKSEKQNVKRDDNNITAVAMNIFIELNSIIKS